MNRRRLFLFLFFVTTAALPSVQAVNDKSKVFLLEQMVRSVGRQDSFVSDRAVESLQMRMGRKMLMRAPTWNVLTINDGNKTYFETSAANKSGLISQRIQLFEGANYDKVNWTAVEEKTIGGIAACRFVDSAKAKNWKFQRRGFEMTEEEIRTNGFWAARDLLVAPEAANALARIDGVPQIGRLPLRLQHCTSNVQKTVTVLDTFSCKISPTNISTLIVPANYKKSRSEFDASVKDPGLMDAFFPEEKKHK